MKNSVYMLLCSLVMNLGCNSYSSSQVSGSNQDSSGTEILKIKLDSSYSYDQFKASIVDVYIDSLNSFRSGSKIPAFLMDPNLDVNSKINDWPNSNFVSLREEIFKKVNNVELLTEVVKTPYFKRQFLDVEKNRARIPSDEISNYTLAQERLNELSKNNLKHK